IVRVNTMIVSATSDTVTPSKSRPPVVVVRAVPTTIGATAHRNFERSVPQEVRRRLRTPVLLVAVGGAHGDGARPVRRLARVRVERGERELVRLLVVHRYEHFARPHRRGHERARADLGAS